MNEADTMNKMTTVKSTVVPFSLKDAPSFIESQFPVGRVSAEAYKERKANLGQTLTGLGSYWKGRKPLILVRATALGCLLPATGNPVEDLRVFLMLMGMDDRHFAGRIKAVVPKDITQDWEHYGELLDNGQKPTWRKDLSKEDRDRLVARWLSTLPYDKRLSFCLRPEEVSDGEPPTTIWNTVNAHLGTTASSLSDFVEQLGIMRFGHRPIVADTFSGGGSIPFEAARIGCNSFASDLNPIACMLTWGAFNVIGANPIERAKVERQQDSLCSSLESEITDLGIENDHQGNRAKAYIYCMETICPKTGWLVPMSPSWIVSKSRNVIARLIPNSVTKRYDILIESGVDAAAMSAADLGTVRDGRLVHPMNPDKNGVAISVIRGDYREDGSNGNKLRRWTNLDFIPSDGDVFQERLYCVQWIKKFSLGKGRQETFFASVSDEDIARERKVESLVRENLADWQADGLIPDMQIEPGYKTDEPIRTRGWTYWHHLFTPRHLLLSALFRKHSKNQPAMDIIFCRCLNVQSRLSRWSPAVGHDLALDVFYNQALNTLYNYGARASISLFRDLKERFADAQTHGSTEIVSCAAKDINYESDIFITDPPYADAVNYHEITEYFIAWLRRSPPSAFRDWRWTSNRAMAIKGSDEKFRAEMVAAYKATSKHMPDNGMQVVMFTHQSASVWADLAAIMWAAGLRVTAAWNIVTETESALKEGNYVQGTILLILRKRLEKRNGRRMNIEGEIEDEVKEQLKRLHAIDEDWTSERLYTDGDLQLAAYAAALRVITSYEMIDKKDVGADVFRKLKKGETTVIRDLIDYAASVANSMLVPEGFAQNLWRESDPHTRFYVRMLDMESKGATRFADYSDFAKTFAVQNYTDLMGSTKANEASLAGAGDLKARVLGDSGFGATLLRRVLFAIFKTMQKEDPKDGLAFLRTEYGPDYWTMRLKLVEFAKYVASKTRRTRPKESEAADLLAQKLEVDRL